MNKNHPLLMIAVFVFLFSSSSCKKDENKTEEPNAFKKEWVTGKWKQKDLVISVDVKLGGQKIPAGSSMIALAPLLGQALGNPAVAQMILCTKDNQYEFNGQGNFTITGCTDLILPNAGNSGTWELTIYNAVLQLTSSDSKKDPHWINTITPGTMELALTVKIPGVGNAPLGLRLEKIQ
jgi:hypothetical protein